MNYLLERDQYARIYGCTPRSIGNYAGHEAPLDKPDAMYDWLWNRRTQPAGFTAKSKEEIVTAYARTCASGAEAYEFSRQEIRDILFNMDIDQLRICCKTMVADGFEEPEYGSAVRDAMNQVLDGIKAAYALIGEDRDEQLRASIRRRRHAGQEDAGEEDEEDEENDDEEEDACDTTAENIIPLPTVGESPMILGRTALAH